MADERSMIGTSLRDAASRLLDARNRADAQRRALPEGPEVLATIGDVDILLDARSTFIDATLRSMAELQRPLVWIAGAGVAAACRNLMPELLRRRVVAVVFFGPVPCAVVDELRTVLDDVYAADDVRTATFLARELATEGKAVLFSPACPSGDGYANYEERAADFRSAVNDL